MLLNKFKLEKVILVIAACFYLLTAYNSSGYHHPDEHYQIIQFAEYKTGHVSIQELPWEFNAKIRSGLQPLICSMIFYTFRLIGVDSPHDLALGLRLITGIFSIAVLWTFYKKNQTLINPEYRYFYLVISLLLWFLPYINVRFSSETWSGLMFVVSITVSLKDSDKPHKKFLLLGALLGLTILFRFQTGFLALGLLLWMLVIQKEKFIHLCITAFGILLIICFGCLVDHWLYGEFTLSIVNYFIENIVHDVASNYGTSPWYEIITYIIKGPGIPLGLLILGSYLTLLMRHPKNMVIWVITPFLFVHMVIPHKELRFLFPIANLIPALIVMSVQEFRFKLKRIWLTLIIIPFGFLNAAALVVNTFKSTRAGENKVSEFISTRFQHEKVNVITSYESNPYDPFMGYKNHFYKPSNITTTEVTSIWHPDFLDFKKADCVNLLILSNSQIGGPRTLQKLNQIGAVNIGPELPALFLKMTRLYDKEIYDKQLNLYLITSP